MKRTNLPSTVAAMAIGLIAVQALAQTTAPKPVAKKAVIKPTSPPKGGPGSLNGVWASVGYSDERTGPPLDAGGVKGVEFEPPPMLPWAAKLAAQRTADAASGHPFAQTRSRCLPAGTPSSMLVPAQLPIEILESPTLKQVTVLFEEFTNYRVIHMGAKHPQDPDPTYLGHSVGHWEGDTLVVDTIGLNDQTTVEGVTPHTEDMHVVERLRRTGPSTMEDRVTVEDPKTFTRPWTIVSRFKRVPGLEMHEYICQNDRNRPDATGRTTTGVP